MDVDGAKLFLKRREDMILKCVLSQRHSVRRKTEVLSDQGLGNGRPSGQKDLRNFVALTAIRMELHSDINVRLIRRIRVVQLRTRACTFIMELGTNS